MMFLTKSIIRSLMVVMVMGMASSSAFAVTETSEATKNQTSESAAGQTSKSTQNQVDPKEIQKALTEAGFYKGSVDGVVGSKTKEAIRKFQEANTLKADGVCGPKTWEKLKAYLEEAAAIDTTATQQEEVAATPALDEEVNSDSSYSEFDTTNSAGANDELKQKLVS